jgi:MFS family permease
MDISPNNISTWIGISTLVYALPECFFAIIWSALSSRVGRKPVICFGLLLLMGANLGVGFCTSIWQILVFTAVSGAANGTASVIQTINAELVPSEKSQAKALAFVPAAAATGAIFGPVIGGLLVKKDFDRNSVLKKHPFALPNIIAGCFTLVAILTAMLFLKVCSIYAFAESKSNAYFPARKHLMDNLNYWSG